MDWVKRVEMACDILRNRTGKRVKEEGTKDKKKREIKIKRKMKVKKQLRERCKKEN